MNVVKRDRQREKRRKERRITQDKEKKEEAFLLELKRWINVVKRDRQKEEKKEREAEVESIKSRSIFV